MVALTRGRMRLAVPVWFGRVSPVFDVAKKLLIVEVIGGEATFTEQHTLEGRDRVNALSQLGVKLVMEIRGEVEEVVRAYLDGRLVQPRFSMPGCHSRRRGARARNNALGIQR